MNSRLLLILPAFCWITACADTTELSPLQKADAMTVQTLAPNVSEKMAGKQPLTVDDVLTLVQSHVEDQVIIRYMAVHDTNFKLTPDKAEMLRKSGASETLIRQLQ